jgi:hypothetical protein
MNTQRHIVQVRYIIIETKEAARIGYNGYLFPHSYSGNGLGATHLGLHLYFILTFRRGYVNMTCVFVCSLCVTFCYKSDVKKVIPYNDVIVTENTNSNIFNRKHNWKLKKESMQCLIKMLHA